MCLPATRGCVKQKLPKLLGSGSICCFVLYCCYQLTQRDIPEPDFSAAPTMIPAMRTIVDIVILCFGTQRYEHFRYRQIFFKIILRSEPELNRCCTFCKRVPFPTLAIWSLWSVPESNRIFTVFSARWVHLLTPPILCEWLESNQHCQGFSVPR